MSDATTDLSSIAVEKLDEVTGGTAAQPATSSMSQLLPLMLLMGRGGGGGGGACPCGCGMANCMRR